METKMATVQTDGSSATTRSSTRNNRGVATNAGSKSSVLQNNALGTKDLGVFGSKVISNANSDYADPALTSGIFANNNQKPISIKYTSVLAGTVSNSFLKGGASDLASRRSIHRQEKVRSTRFTTAYRAGYWNIYTGEYTTPPTTAVDNFWGATTGSSATSTDVAASVTRTAPGDLTYKLGSKTPVSVGYSPKNT